MIAKFGVPPERIVDYLSIIGDAVDNVPGVPKAGEVTDKGRSKCIQVSTKELRHHSKMTEQKQWMRKQTQHYREYARISTSLPTLRTGDFDECIANVKDTLAVAEFLFNFQLNSRSVSERFMA